MSPRPLPVSGFGHPLPATVSAEAAAVVVKRILLVAPGQASPHMHAPVTPKQRFADEASAKLSAERRCMSRASGKSRAHACQSMSWICVGHVMQMRAASAGRGGARRCTRGRGSSSMAGGAAAGRRLKTTGYEGGRSGRQAAGISGAQATSSELASSQARGG